MWATVYNFWFERVFNAPGGSFLRVGQVTIFGYTMYIKDYLSNLATIITMVVIVILCCLLIKKIYNMCAHIIG